MKRLLTFISILCLLSACYYDNEEELYPTDPNCPVEAISYQNDIRPLVNTNCAISGCHVAGTGRVNFTTFAGLKSVADDGRLRQKVLVEKSMPPSRPLTSCEQAQIEAWLAAGALEN